MEQNGPPADGTPTVEIVRYVLISLALAVAAFVPLSLPFFEGALIILPLPALVATARYGARTGAIVAVSAAVPGMLLAGPGLAVPVLTATLALGVGQALLTRSGVRASRLLAICIGVFVILAGIGTAFAFATKTLTLSTLRKMSETLQRELARYGGTSTQQSEEALRAFRDLYVYVLPAGLIVLCCVAGLASFLISQRVLRGRGLPNVSLPPFKDWQVPWYMAWGFLLGLAAAVGYRYLDRQSGMITMYVGLNLMIVFGTLFMVQGLSLVLFFCDKFKLRPGVRALLLLLAGLLQSLVQALTWLGLFDVWFNYRKLKRDV